MGLQAGISRRPARAAVLTTFAVSEVVHNALAYAISGRITFFTAVWFMALGVITVVSEALKLRFDRLPPPFRTAVVCAHLALGYQVAEAILG